MNQIGNDDEIGTSADSLDLSPRPVSARQRRKRRPWPAIIVLLLVVVSGGVVLTKFLTSAIDLAIEAFDAPVAAALCFNLESISFSA